MRNKSPTVSLYRRNDVKETKVISSSPGGYKASAEGTAESCIRCSLHEWTLIAYCLSSLSLRCFLSLTPFVHPFSVATHGACLGGASCYRVARTLRKEIMTTQKDWPTPNTSASSEIILFPAALYTPAIAAPVGHTHTIQSFKTDVCQRHLKEQYYTWLH